MKTNVVQYEEHTPVKEIFRFLSRASVPRVVVVHQNRPTGVISRATLLRWLRIGPMCILRANRPSTRFRSARAAQDLAAPPTWLATDSMRSDITWRNWTRTSFPVPSPRPPAWKSWHTTSWLIAAARNGYRFLAGPKNTRHIDRRFPSSSSAPPAPGASASARAARCTTRDRRTRRSTSRAQPPGRR